MSNQARVWIAAGVALDLAGAVLVSFSALKMGPLLAGGAALLLAGSFLVFQGVLRLARQRPALPSTVHDQSSPGWSPEPELQLAPPRPVALTATGKWSLGLWAAMLLIAAGYVFWAPPRAASPPQLLREYGMTATATIHDKAVHPNAAGQKVYYVYYNFEGAQGEKLRSSRRVSKRLYDSLAVGDTLEVIYFPQEPLQHFVPRLEQQPIPVAMQWAVAALLGILVIIFEFQRRYHRRLVSHGRPVEGTVENVRRRGGSRVFTVQYSVHGQERSLRASERNPERADGDRVTVLYLPERPERALLYRTSLYGARLS